MIRDVFWLPTALEDLKSIARHIAKDNPGAARRVASAIRKTGEAMGRRSLGRPGRVAGTREKRVVDLPYILAYVIDNATPGPERIVILHVIHTARNWPQGKWPSPS